MKFGYFDDNACEYVITTPKTPLPWINYLGNKEFWATKSSFHLFQIPVEVTHSIRMPSFCA